MRVFFSNIDHSAIELIYGGQLVWHKGGLVGCSGYESTGGYKSVMACPTRPQKVLKDRHFI